MEEYCAGGRKFMGQDLQGFLRFRFRFISRILFREPLNIIGISLWKIHHAAFDKLSIGIRPDYTIEIRSDIMTESDGPMLLHGLQKLDGQMIIGFTEAVDWPNREFLEKRYDIFIRTG